MANGKITDYFALHALYKYEQAQFQSEVEGDVAEMYDYLRNKVRGASTTGIVRAHITPLLLSQAASLRDDVISQKESALLDVDGDGEPSDENQTAIVDIQAGIVIMVRGGRASSNEEERTFTLFTEQYVSRASASSSTNTRFTATLEEDDANTYTLTELQYRLSTADYSRVLQHFRRRAHPPDLVLRQLVRAAKRTVMYSRVCRHGFT
jgi:hypothetical protein